MATPRKKPAAVAGEAGGTAKSPAAKSPAAKSPAAKSPAAKSTTAEISAAKAPAAKIPAAKIPAAKAPAAKIPAARDAGAKSAAGKGTAAKSTAAPAAKGTGAKSSAARSGAPRGRTRAGSGWSKAELDAVRTQLEAEVEHLSAEITTIDHQVADLIQDSGDGAGDDQAESGSKAFEREHEQTLANIARDVIVQSRHALERIADGTYGTCESCGRLIAKPRLQAFPRATLCVECKQREEQH